MRVLNFISSSEMSISFCVCACLQSINRSTPAVILKCVLTCGNVESDYSLVFVTGREERILKQFQKGAAEQGSVMVKFRPRAAQ